MNEFHDGVMPRIHMKKWSAGELLWRIQMGLTSKSKDGIGCDGGRIFGQKEKDYEAFTDKET